MVCKDSCVQNHANQIVRYGTDWMWMNSLSLALYTSHTLMILAKNKHKKSMRQVVYLTHPCSFSYISVNGQGIYAFLSPRPTGNWIFSNFSVPWRCRVIAGQVFYECNILFKLSFIYWIIVVVVLWITGVFCNPVTLIPPSFMLSCVQATGNRYPSCVSVNNGFISPQSLRSTKYGYLGFMNYRISKSSLQEIGKISASPEMLT